MIELTLDNNISTLEIYDLSLIEDVAVRIEDGVELAQIITSQYDTLSVLASAKAVKKLIEYAKEDEHQFDKVYKITRAPERVGNEIIITEVLTAKDGKGNLTVLEIVQDGKLEGIFKDVKERLERRYEHDRVIRRSTR
jgi:hypothetical protein|nr:MAG TPA: hypothetical protein [Caudoviricetes sp.]